MTLLNTYNGNHEAEKVYQAYYTKSSSIVTTMVDNLSLQEDHKILEPCGGDGIFIDAILAQKSRTSIDVYELNHGAIKILEKKYENRPNVNVFQGDFLTDEHLQIMTLSGGVYDRIIANPPYGAWQDLAKRKQLKKIFPDLYVKETYTLFLYRCIQLLKIGGMLTFIIPDSFLNLHRHTQLRYKLFNSCKIHRIQLFPSNFFPDINFGYTGLCIITLEKASSELIAQANELTVETNYASVQALQSAESVKKYSFYQKDILCQPDAALFVAENKKVTQCLNSASCYIGDVAECVTGFYSGNDKHFLRTASVNNKNRKKYEPFKNDLAFKGHDVPLDGINDEQCFVPIVKGGNTRYYKQNNWYMNWSKQSVTHYRESKKARFQNSQFYFRDGIAVPMVSAKFITASLLDKRLFDQSIVGIFPQDSSLTYYLLGLLNSPTANQLIRTINPTTNNSANYIKKIPFILPLPSQLERIDHLMGILVNQAQAGLKVNADFVKESNSILQSIYGF